MPANGTPDLRRPEPPRFSAARPIFLIDGQRRNDIGAALLFMDVRLPRHGMAHAELRLQATPVRGSFPFPDLSHGLGLVVRGASEEMPPVFQGHITAIEFRMGNGPPELAILAEDALHRLARSLLPHQFDDTTADEVVRSLADRVGLQADTNLGGSAETFVKGAESDLAFLLRTVSARGGSLRLDGDRVRAGPEPPDPQPLSIAADALKELRIIADLNWQPGTVTARGWNLAEATVAEATAAPEAQAPSQGAAAIIENLGWAARYTLPRDFVEGSVLDAIADVEATRAAERFLHGEIVGTLPELRPGRVVELSGTDPRFAGRYRVGDCRHHYSAAEGAVVRARIARSHWNHDR
jgi:hypothetical protein